MAEEEKKKEHVYRCTRCAYYVRTAGTPTPCPTHPHNMIDRGPVRD